MSVVIGGSRSIQTLQQDFTRVRPSVPQGVPTETVVRTGAFQLRAPNGQAFALPSDGRVVSIGRLPESDVPIHADNVSRLHATMRMVDGQVQIRDEGSYNGTTANGHRLEPHQWYVLAPQTQVGFAGVPMTVQEPPATGRIVPSLGQPTAQSVTASAVGGPAGVGLRVTLGGLKALASRTSLESKADYLQSARAAGAEMARTPGAVDLPPGVPTVFISDLHARRDFLTRVMDSEIDGEKVFNLLEQGRVNVVCLGDGMHAEGRAEERWKTSLQDFLQGRSSAAMEQEMVESLGTMKMVMDLKNAFPQNFHFLRGNHDEMNGKDFSKYAAPFGESFLVREWVKSRFGEDFLQDYAHFENQMPLVARGQGFVASHAAPGVALSKDEIEGRSPRAFAALSWTDNRDWQPDDPKHQERLRSTLGQLGADENSTWIVGHRPVESGLFRQQLGGQLLQINHPSDYVVAIVRPSSPQVDVVKV